jgi:hypothetical protein
MFTLLRLLLLAGASRKQAAAEQFAIKITDLLVSLQLITFPTVESEHTITATITGLSISLEEA